MKKILTSALIFSLLSEHVFASVEIISLLPNPVGDDTLGEYIEIRNTGCSTEDIGGYSLSDASTKTYIIPGNTLLPKQESLRFPYSTTKISLNNSGEETINLKDSSGILIDTYVYSGTQKENAILLVDSTDENCDQSLPDIPIESSTGSEDIPIVLSGSEEVFSTGELINTGNIIDTASGSLSASGVEIIFSGATEEVVFGGSGGTESGTVDDGDSFTGISNDPIPLDESQSGILQTPIPGDIILSATGYISPSWLYYADEDKNGKIDTLEIMYPIELTGAVDITKIALYSNSGGLYSYKINTATGYITSGYISGNTMMLKLFEGDIIHDILSISQSTNSDLRLKSSSDIGIMGIDGRKGENLFLTSSFGDYKNVSKKVLEPVPGEILSSSGDTVSGEVSIPITDTTGIHNESIFPEIIPTFQSPTNAKYISGVLLCDENPCRINLTLEPMFGSGYLMKDFICSFGSGGELLLDSDCNPNTYTFSQAGVIDIELEMKGKGKVTSKKIPLEFTIEKDDESIDEKIDVSLDIGKPVLILEIDGKWSDNYEQIGDYEMNCYTSTCSINFTLEKSYDPEGSSLHFLWLNGANLLKTSKDPGALKFGMGDHRMSIRVIDEAGNYTEIQYIIHVLGPQKKEIPKKVQSIKSPKNDKVIASDERQKKKKFRKIKMEFFTPPTIVLQGKTGRKMSEEHYSCLYKTTKTCLFNLTLSGTTKGYDYIWYLDGEVSYRGKNPKGWKLTPGIHSIDIESILQGGTATVSRQSITVKVSQEPKKVKKAKKKVTPLKKKTSAKKIKILPNAYAGSEGITGESEQSNGSIALIILSLGLGVGYILRGRKKFKSF